MVNRFKIVCLMAILSKEAEVTTLPYDIQLYHTFLRKRRHIISIEIVKLANRR